MKKIILLPVLALFSCMSFVAAAQEPVEKPATVVNTVPEKGYWVVESNINQPRHACVYFYTDNNVLVYKQIVDGKRLRSDKLGTQLKLRETCDMVVSAWEAGHTVDKQAVAMNALLQK